MESNNKKICRNRHLSDRKRYAGRTDKVTQQKMQQDIMELYQKENYSMFGGCLPTLIQFPIIIALYNVIRNPLTYLMRLGDYVAPIKEKILELNADAKILAEIDMFQYLHDLQRTIFLLLLRLRYLTCHRRPVFLIKAGFYLFR